MVASVLDSVPAHIKTPENLELKISAVDANSVGVYSVWPVAEGTQFGPYVGKIVPAAAAKGIDRRFSWEVFNLDTLTLIHVLDATDPKDGNWMRYVNCARFFEEQNIVSAQTGDDIYYKAIKNIEPGEELLTWFKPKRGRKRKSTTDQQEVRVKQEQLSDNESLSSKKTEPELTEKMPEKTKRIRKPKIIPDAYEGPLLVPKKSKPQDDDQFEPLKPGQLRRRRKKKSTESEPCKDSPEKVENDILDKTIKESSFSEKTQQKSSDKTAKLQNAIENGEPSSPPIKCKMKRGRTKLKLETELKGELNKTVKREKSPKTGKTSPPTLSATGQLVEINSSVSWVYPEKGQEYIFNLEKHMITQGPNGCVYTCDICNGIYKNKFSLKRHYLRNHINYRYLSKADIINCLINLQQVLEAEGDSVKQIKRRRRRAMKQRKESVSESDTSHIKSDEKNADTENCQTTCDKTSDRANDTSEIMTESNELFEPMSDSYLDEKGEISFENVLSVSKSDENTENGMSNIKLVVVDERELMKDRKLNTNGGDNFANNIDDSKAVSKLANSENMDKGSVENLMKGNIDLRVADSGRNKAKKKHVGVYRCYTCREIFDTVAEIRDHTMGHSEKDSVNMPYQCDKCSMRFFFKQNLLRHSASHKDMTVTMKKESSSATSPVFLKDEDIHRNHQCATCRQRFETLEKLTKHQVKHKSDWAKKKFPCQYCGKDFLSVANMKKHVRFHLGYRITCRYCTDVFSNVGALRKHTRISHPEIYKAKQLDKIARHGVLRRPDKKQADNKEEIEVKREAKAEKEKKGLKRKSSKETISEIQDSDKVEIKEEATEIKEETFHYDHDISFAADEIDDGGSRFKFSCTVCKKRFSNYINMCRHRRKVHSNESKPKTEEPVLRLNPKKQPPIIETPEEIALFYASVSHNIATNLNEYIDGKPESLEKFRDHIKIDDYRPVSFQTEKDDKPVNLTWEMYNFPPNFKPGKTISFSEIRKEFDIHSDFDSHCKSFLSDSESQCEIGNSLSGEKKKVPNEIDRQTVIRDNEKSDLVDEGLGNSSTESLELKLKGLDRGEKEVAAANIDDTSTSVKNTYKTSSITTTTKPDIYSLNKDTVNSDMDLTAKKAHILVRKQVENSKLSCASPCTLGFKHIEKGEYANFDDLLIGDIESPIVPRSQSVSSSSSYVKRDTCSLKAVNDNKSSDTKSVHGTVNLETEVVRKDKRDENVDHQNLNPKPLSLLCENLLGLKRKQSGVSYRSSSENSSLSSLDSLCSGGQATHNSSLLTTLSLAMSQKEDERFQSTNQIFRDIKADYSEAPNHSLDNYHSIAFGKNGQVACVCAICKKHFRDFECLIRHHWKKHPASVCHFIEVEQGHEIDALHFSEPSTVGALAVTDPGLENALDREVFTCTKCGTSFTTLAKLHVHIINCAPLDPVQGIVREEKGSKTPIKKRFQKKMKNILNGGSSFKFKIKDFAGYTVGNEKDTEEPDERKSQNRVFTGFRKRTSMILPDSPVKLVHRKSQDMVGYNPQNHVRRRELTELVDSHQCEACGLKFKTIILLERHVPNCSKKEKFKDLCPMKCPIMDESLEKLKHVCHYCKKHFTYLKSLVNHLQDFCAVKKQKADDGSITEEDKLNESEILGKFKKLEEEKNMKDELKDVDVGKKKGWQKGLKRKPKRKGHSWTVIKKKKPSTSIDEVELDTSDVNQDEHEMISGLEAEPSKDLIDHVNNSDAENETLYSGNEEITDAVVFEDNPRKVINTKGNMNCADENKLKSSPLPDDSEVNPGKIELGDSIDEVDSGQEIHVKDNYLHSTLERDDAGFVLDLEPETYNKTSTDSEPMPSKELLPVKKICLKESHMLDECLEQRTNILLSQDCDLYSLHSQESVKNTDKIVVQSKAVNSNDKIVTELTSEELKSVPVDLEMNAIAAKRQKAKSLFSQCLGSQVNLTESINGDKEMDSGVKKVEEKKKSIVWQKFTNSLKQQLGRSKRKYKVNDEMIKQSVSKVKEIKINKVQTEMHGLSVQGIETGISVEKDTVVTNCLKTNKKEADEETIQNTVLCSVNMHTPSCNEINNTQPFDVAVKIEKLKTNEDVNNMSIPEMADENENLEMNKKSGKKGSDIGPGSFKQNDIFTGRNKLDVSKDNLYDNKRKSSMPNNDTAVQFVMNSTSLSLVEDINLSINDPNSSSIERNTPIDPSLTGNICTHSNEIHVKHTKSYAVETDVNDLHVQINSQAILAKPDRLSEGRLNQTERKRVYASEHNEKKTALYKTETQSDIEDIVLDKQNCSNIETKKPCIQVDNRESSDQESVISGSDKNDVVKDSKNVSEPKLNTHTTHNAIEKDNQSIKKYDQICDMLNKNAVDTVKDNVINENQSDFQFIENESPRGDEIPSNLKGVTFKKAKQKAADTAMKQTDLNIKIESVKCDKVSEFVSEKIEIKKRAVSPGQVSNKGNSSDTESENLSFQVCNKEISFQESVNKGSDKNYVLQDSKNNSKFEENTKITNDAIENDGQLCKKYDQVFDKSADSFVNKNAEDTVKDNMVNEKQSDLQTINNEKSRDNAISSNQTGKISEGTKAIGTREKQTDTIINKEAIECDQVYESVSEKVKKRKRNASIGQVSESVCKFTSKLELPVKRQSVSVGRCKKSSSGSKDAGHICEKAKEPNSFSQENRELQQSTLTEELKKDEIMRNQQSTNSNGESIQDRNAVKSKKNISKSNLENNTSPSKLRKKMSSKQEIKGVTHSPVKSIKPYEIVLSPSERVKMNRRHCKKDTYDFGFTRRITQRSSNMIKKESENTMLNTRSGSEIVEEQENKNCSDRRIDETDMPSLNTKNVKLKHIPDDSVEICGASDYTVRNTDCNIEETLEDGKKLPKITSNKSPRRKIVEQKPSQFQDESCQNVKNRGRPKRKANSGDLQSTPFSNKHPRKDKISNTTI